MEILNNKTNLDEFYLSLAAKDNRILMLDYDGTLSPFTPDRDKAYPYPRVETLLNDIIKEGTTRVILITGRPIDDLLKLINLPALPEIWGAHGFERLMPDGKRFSTQLNAEVSNAILQYEKAFIDYGLIKHCERKPSGIAIHWRGCTNNEIRNIKDKLLQISDKVFNSSILISDFDGGKEIRICGIDKGFAVRNILPAKSEQYISAYLGDDLTDEDAFIALGEKGLKVLVRESIRKTVADVWLSPPKDLLWFLEQWLLFSLNKKPAK